MSLGQTGWEPTAGCGYVTNSEVTGSSPTPIFKVSHDDVHLSLISGLCLSLREYIGLVFYFIMGEILFFRSPRFLLNSKN